MRNTNIKSSKSRHAVLCHTEKTHLQPLTTQCLTTFDPGPCDRSALFARPVAQAWPPPSLWMASTLRRFSSVKPVQHRLQTLMASNPPRCPTTGSPGRDVLTCCGLLWSRIVGDPDLGGSDAGPAQVYLAGVSIQYTGTSHSMHCSSCRLDSQ